MTDADLSPADDPPSATLAAALEQAGLAVPPEAVPLLERYCQALWRWNEQLNLTRHTNYDLFVRRDLTDTLAFSRALEGAQQVLDFGTGGGVPGVPLAILRPDLRVLLTDSVGKKARAVQQIVAELGLSLPVFAEPGQGVILRERPTTVIVRAVAPLSKLLVWLRPCWGAFQRLLVLKGPAWVEERLEARQRGLLSDFDLRRIDEYPLPGTAGTSVLLAIAPKEGVELAPVPLPVAAKSAMPAAARPKPAPRAGSKRPFRKPGGPRGKRPGRGPGRGPGR